MKDPRLVLKLFDKFLKFNYWLVYVAVFAIIISVLLDSINPITIRFFHFQTTPVQKELIEELLLIMIYVPFAYVLMGPGHIKTELIKRRFGRRLGFAADMLVDSATFALGVIIFSASISRLQHVIKYDSIKAGEVQFSMLPFDAAMSFSFLMIIIASILLMLKHIYIYKKGEPEEELPPLT